MSEIRHACTIPGCTGEYNHNWHLMRREIEVKDARILMLEVALVTIRNKAMIWRRGTESALIRLLSSIAEDAMNGGKK